jgi:hypothetical protein
MKTYEVQINGVTHFLQLSDEDAKHRGLTGKDVESVAAADAESAAAAEAKAKEEADAQAAAEAKAKEEADAKAAAQPANKSRTADNK